MLIYAVLGRTFYLGRGLVLAGLGQVEDDLQVFLHDRWWLGRQLGSGLDQVLEQ